MIIHHCIFKILGKNSVAEGHMDGPTDNVKTVYPHKVCVCVWGGGGGLGGV